MRPGKASVGPCHPTKVRKALERTATGSPGTETAKGVGRCEVEKDHPIRRSRRGTLQLLEPHSVAPRKGAALVGERGKERTVLEDHIEPSQVPFDPRRREVAVDREVHRAGPGILARCQLGESPQPGVRGLPSGPDRPAPPSERPGQRTHQGRLAHAVDPFDDHEDTATPTRHSAPSASSSGRQPYTRSIASTNGTQSGSGPTAGSSAIAVARRGTVARSSTAPGRSVSSR